MMNFYILETTIILIEPGLFCSYYFAIKIIFAILLFTSNSFKIDFKIYH